MDLLRDPVAYGAPRVRGKAVRGRAQPGADVWAANRLPERPGSRSACRVRRRPPSRSSEDLGPPRFGFSTRRGAELWPLERCAEGSAERLASQGPSEPHPPDEAAAATRSLASWPTS